MVLRQAARLLDCPRLLQQGCLLPLPYQQGGRAKRLCSSRSCLNLKIWSRYVFAGTRDGLARGDCRDGGGGDCRDDGGGDCRDASSICTCIRAQAHRCTSSRNARVTDGI